MLCYNCGGEIGNCMEHYELELKKIKYYDGPAPFVHIKSDSILTLNQGRLCKGCLINWRNHSMLNPLGGRGK